MRNATVCILRREGEVLLAMKKRGFGVGRWNGVGGKQQEGETVEQTALREMEEEIGVRTTEDKLDKIASLKFFFPKEREDWNQEVHIYFINDWEGEPIESEEMCPAWFGHEQIPFGEMWPDDILWPPRALSGEKLEGEFYFNDDGNTFERYDLRNLSSGI